MLKRGLIVSCQAEEGSPFNSPEFIVAFARAAEQGGASAVRICGIDNIKAVREEILLPIIGITKEKYPDGSVLITPTVDDCLSIIEAGASVVAADATRRVRPAGLTGKEMIAKARTMLTAPIMADIATYEEAIEAVERGADFVGTTLAGYTRETEGSKTDEPDFELVRRLAARFPDRVIAEGRIWTPEQAKKMVDLGAHAVVVGTAITRPVEIVKRFARQIV